MDVESLILTPNCPPLLFCNTISDWPASSWTPEFLASQLLHQKMSCKIAPLSKEGDLWESDCQHETVTLEDFVDWVNSEKCRGDNPLNKYDRHKFSCYIDYKYMKDVFIHHTDLLKGVKWETFGFGELDGWNSTIWIGSEGCYTNCHYDTYGFNLVAQIYGRKRWILFPPEDTNGMYPTRIPYEESSVYSNVNLKNPNLSHHPDFKACHPHVVVLEPGDVLYVPRHWWHYVECLEPAISINTWVDLDADRDARVHEAVTMAMVMSFNGSLSTGNQTAIVNPGENVCSTDTAILLLREALSQNLTTGTCRESENKLKNFAHHFQSVLPQNTSKDLRHFNVSKKEIKDNSQIYCASCRTQKICRIREYEEQSVVYHDNYEKQDVATPTFHKNRESESCQSKRKHSFEDEGGSLKNKTQKLENNCVTCLDPPILSIHRDNKESEVAKEMCAKFCSGSVNCKGKITSSNKNGKVGNTETGSTEPEVYLLNSLSVDKLFCLSSQTKTNVSDNMLSGCSGNDQESEKVYKDDVLMTQASADADDVAMVNASFVNNFVKCATHPDVISLIIEKLKNIKH